MPTDPFKEFTAKLDTAPTSAGGLSEAQLCPPVCALIEGVGAELGLEIGSSVATKSTSEALWARTVALRHESPGG